MPHTRPPLPLLHKKIINTNFKNSIFRVSTLLRRVRCGLTTSQNRTPKPSMLFDRLLCAALRIQETHQESNCKKYIIHFLHHTNTSDTCPAHIYRRIVCLRVPLIRTLSIFSGVFLYSGCVCFFEQLSRHSLEREWRSHLRVQCPQPVLAKIHYIHTLLHCYVVYLWTKYSENVSRYRFLSNTACSNLLTYLGTVF